MLVTLCLVLVPTRREVLCALFTHHFFHRLVVVMRGNKLDDETTNLNQEEHRGIPHSYI